MLKNLKNKDKTKKDPKKDTKTKTASKQQPEEQQDIETEQNTDLVDVNELKQDQTKVKQVTRKKNDYQLEEKEIDISNLNLAKNQQPKVRTTWIANSVEEVMKGDFKMEKIEHEFESLTDQDFNQKQKQKLLAKQKQQQNKPKIIEQNGVKIQTFQKTADQLKMERAEQQMAFKSGNTPSSIKTTDSVGPVINFTNSAIGKEFAPIQKTAQELKMEEMQRKQQEMTLKKPTTSWIGSKKTNQTPEEKPAFKQSVWATMATQNQDNDIANNIKFAPLNANEQKPKQAPTTQAPKSSGWAASNVQQQNGLKFAPLQLSEQQKRLQGAERKEQQMVYVSKKEIQQRKRKREERQKMGLGKQQPKV